MAATQTKKTIANIKHQIDALEQAIAVGVPVDAPLYFVEIAKQGAIGAAASVSEFGEQ